MDDMGEIWYESDFSISFFMASEEMPFEKDGAQNTRKKTNYKTTQGPQKPQHQAKDQLMKVLGSGCH